MVTKFITVTIFHYIGRDFIYLNLIIKYERMTIGESGNNSKKIQNLDWAAESNIECSRQDLNLRPHDYQ